MKSNEDLQEIVVDKGMRDEEEKLSSLLKLEVLELWKGTWMNEEKNEN